jgi:hypothetical protein
MSSASRSKSFAAFTVESAKPKHFFKRCFCAPVELPEVSAIAELALR